MYISAEVRKELSEEDLLAVDAYRDQLSISLQFKAIMAELMREFSGSFIDFHLKARIEERLHQAAATLKEGIQILKSFTPMEKHNLVFCLKCDSIQDSVTVYPTEPLNSILECTYGHAVRYSLVAAKIKRIEDIQYRKKQEEHNRLHYIGTHVKRSEYPCNDETSMSPAEMRERGYIPKGYELVPMEVLALLIEAGRDPYSLAVGGETNAQMIRQASRAAQNLVDRRQTAGKKK
jgi:hypothetical protein